MNEKEMPMKKTKNKKQDVKTVLGSAWQRGGCRTDAPLSSNMRDRDAAEESREITISLVSTDHKFGKKLVRERVEIHAVELGTWTTSKVGF
jgi:hypothetical protein